MEEQFTQTVSFRPAFDKRHSDPKQNYGIHGVDIYFKLKGTKGAVSLTVMSQMYLPHVADELLAKGQASIHYNPFHVDGGGLCYHDTKPHYESQEKSECDILEAGECYSDCSFIGGSDLAKKLVAEGDAAIWQGLKEFYHSHFEA
jgi:hypothetical protein